MVKCAVKMLGRIPRTLRINRTFPLRSLHCGELTEVNFIITTSERVVYNMWHGILNLTFTFIHSSVYRSRRSGWFACPDLLDEVMFANIHMHTNGHVIVHRI